MLDRDDATIGSLVAANMASAIRMARKHEGRGVDRDDLESEAQLGLLMAARKAVEGGAVRDFPAYSAAAVAGHLDKLVRDAPVAHVAGIPHRLREAAEKCRKATECLAARGIRRPMPDQIAGEANISPRAVEMVMAIPGVVVRQAAIEWADGQGRAAYHGGVSLMPLFGRTPGFDPGRPCSEIHRGPIPRDEPAVCMVCHESGLDHRPEMKRSRLTDPRPEPGRAAHRPSRPPGPAVATRRERRQLLWPPDPDRHG